jgi:hypothetical protein
MDGVQLMTRMPDAQRAIDEIRAVLSNRRGRLGGPYALLARIEAIVSEVPQLVPESMAIPARAVPPSPGQMVEIRDIRITKNTQPPETT